MKSRAFIKAAAAEDLIVETGEGQMLVHAVDGSVMAVIAKRFILFPLVLLPLALLAYNISQYNAGLPMMDFNLLAEDPGAFFDRLPQGKDFWYFVFAPIPFAFLLYTTELFRVLRRPRMVVSAAGITLTTQFPASSTSVDLSNVQEVQVIEYLHSATSSQSAHFLALALPEGIWDYLAAVEHGSREGLQKLYKAADYMGRALAKPVRHLDSKGNTVEREAAP